MVLAINWAQIAVATPIGFALGVLAGLRLSARYALVSRREYKIVRRDERRDYNHARGGIHQ